MAKRKILDYDGLQAYDSAIKEHIETKTANLDNAVLTTTQELTDEQKAQARANIGAYNYDWHHIPYSESYPDKLYASNINGSGNGINDWDLAMSSVGSNGTSNLHGLLNSMYIMSKGTSVIHSNITSKIPAFFQAIVSTGALMNDNNIQLIITYDSDITFRKAHVCLLNYNSSTDKYILIVDDDYKTNIQFTSDGTITFNSLVKEIDNTLSQPYRPAGSKAVGDALALKADKTALDEAIDAIPQSDWNQNDETAKDYVKNRPFYTEEVILCEKMASLEDNVLPVVTYELGKNYIVEVNNIPIELTFVSAYSELAGEYRVGFNIEDGYRDVIKGDICEHALCSLNTYTEEELSNGLITDELELLSGKLNLGSVNVKVLFTAIQQLDPKYIPDMYYEYIAQNTDFVFDSWFNAEEDNWWFYSDYFGLESFLVEGATYIVTCNDETYTCTARCDNYGGVYIGNQAIVEDDWDEGTFPEIIESNEPFFLYTFEEEFDYGLCIQTAGEYSIVIRGTGEKLTPHKIDMKYMPDSIMYGMRNQWNEINNIYNNLNSINVDSKMDKENPTGTGSFSMNRKAGTTIGTNSHAEGYNTTASGQTSHAEGGSTTASGICSHAEGVSTTASGTYSHSEGNNTTASGMESHAEGSYTTASGNYSHAEGNDTKASGQISHAEGYGTGASGNYSHAEGESTSASGNCSHSEGYCTVASGENQHVQGKFNIDDIDADGNPLNTYAHIVGNGSSVSARSNAHTLDWDGNAWFAGDVYVGSTSGTNMDEGSKKLVTEDAIDFDEIEILAETGVVDPVTDENGQVLTDANNTIYIF